MLSRSALFVVLGALSLSGLSGCKSAYSDTFAYKKNSFKPPVVKQTELKPPADIPIPLEGLAPAGELQGAPAGIPGGLAPDAGGIPGALPGAVPGLPEAAPAPGAAPAPAVPGAAPAIPGLN